MAPDDSTSTYAGTHIGENDLEGNENDGPCTPASNRKEKQGKDETWQQRLRQWFVNNKKEGRVAAAAGAALLCASAIGFYKYPKIKGWE